MAGDAVLDAHATTGDGAGHEIGTGFDAIGDHRVGRPVQLLDAFDHEGRRACTRDARAHGIEAGHQVPHFGLAGRAVDDRAPLGQGRGHQHVHRPGHRRARGRAQEDLATGQPRAVLPAGNLSFDEALFQGDLRAEGGQSLDVHVDGSHAKNTATGQAHLGAPKAPHQGPEYADGGAHLAHLIPGRLPDDVPVRLDGRRTVVTALDPTPHGLE